MSAKKDPTRTQFKPGPAWTGNRNGQPVRKSIAQLAREHGPDVIKRLRFWLDQDEFPAASIKAAELLLDRGFGKSVQPIADGSNHEALMLDLSHVSFEQLRKYENTMTKLLAHTHQIQDTPVEIEADAEVVTVIDPTKFEGSA